MQCGISIRCSGRASPWSSARGQWFGRAPDGLKTGVRAMDAYVKPTLGSALAASPCLSNKNSLLRRNLLINNCWRSRF